MNPPRVRRLTFELLETKASPSALLLALAPLDEADQEQIESARALYAAPLINKVEINPTNAALMKFIEENTRSSADVRSARPMPTAAEAAAADTMMMATDTDLRSMLITEMLNASSASGENVFSVILY